MIAAPTINLATEAPFAPQGPHERLETLVRGYIGDNFLFDKNAADLPGDASFLDLGIIDSTGVLEIILFIEQEFGIKMEDHEMMPENLDSVNNIVRFVAARRTAG